MRDRLPKRVRVDWILVIRLMKKTDDFLIWVSQHKRWRIKSSNRLSYLFVKKTFGQEFIDKVQSDPDGWSFCYMVNI